jgi:hypothetical protein
MVSYGAIVISEIYLYDVTITRNKTTPQRLRHKEHLNKMYPNLIRDLLSP